MQKIPTPRKIEGTKKVAQGHIKQYIYLFGHYFGDTLHKGSVFPYKATEKLHKDLLASADQCPNRINMQSGLKAGLF